MAVLRGYFDDSGQSDLPALSVAGYVGAERLWSAFEIEWKSALARNQISYFHMKEISKPSSPMHKFFGVENKDKSEALFRDLATALNRCWSLKEFAAIGCVVPKEPLERFNKARGRRLQAIPLAIFTCDVLMQHYFEGKTIEAWLDRIEKPESKIALAKEYLRTSPRMIGRRDLSTITSVKGELSAKNLQPLQAADFAAWEARKKYDLLEPFFSEVDLSNARSNMDIWYEYESWMERTGRSYDDERKSLTALGEATTFRCPIWTYEVLCSEDDRRDGKWRES
ncbi:hypothetical protein [Bradyrhizobium sp. RD5-C2]|uniref:hypothetical protein n=1 Tax=Bradyrhizobium sp. RD5-C2 TaxID=244562 RepID=UPI001CC62E63|nr:hypothetical protein [Bradyrhizobium sp. RD5-C2]GIQ76209.1 hypothetical protein BraRD5C2_46530 [Bradyrhizobium sp. RD5-C2]